jgi:hypothetical protein
MKQRYFVRPEVVGKRVTVVRGSGNRQETDVYVLSSNQSEQEINRMLAAGVDISHFHGTDEGMKMMKAFVVGNSKQLKMLSGRTKTKLVTVKQGAGSVAAAEPKVVVEKVVEPNPGADFALRLIEQATGLTVEDVKALADGDQSVLEGKDVKKIGGLLGLKGNFGENKVSEELAKLV